MKPTPETSFESIGRATFLPGMVHMLELMDQYVNEFRSELEAMQRSGAPPPEPDEVPLKRKRGRPLKRRRGLMPTAGMKRGTPEFRAVDAANKRLLRNSKKKLNAYGWGDMTPEERQAEMKRRRALGKWNRTRQKIAEAAKSRWSRMTRKEQQAHIAVMQAGRATQRKNQHVNGAA